MPKEIGQPWYGKEAGFFGSYYLQAYAQDITHERTQKEVAFVRTILPIEKYKRIFDLACGHGRHAIELARLGYSVTGQDINTFFLQRAKEAQGQYGVDVHWKEGDMRSVDYGEDFDAVINMFTSFGYFENDDEDQKVLYGIGSALRPGGKFVLGVSNKEQFIKTPQKKERRKLSDGSVYYQEQTFDSEKGRSYHAHTRIFTDGTQNEKHTTVRRYALEELVEMCKKANLHFSNVYGGYGGETYNKDSRYCILVVDRRVKD